MRETSIRLLGWVMLLALVGAPAYTDTNLVQPEIPDVELVNQNGIQGRFLSDFIGERMAVVTFTFTSCGTICPLLDGIFKRVQTDLAESLGEETVLLTVSVDPTTDVPERLHEHAKRLGARPGWSFLTGEQDTVNELLKGMEVYSPDILDHAPNLFVVDGRREVWTRLYGFPKPEKIAEVLDRYRSERSVRSGS